MEIYFTICSASSFKGYSTGQVNLFINGNIVLLVLNFIAFFIIIFKNVCMINDIQFTTHFYAYVTSKLATIRNVFFNSRYLNHLSQLIDAIHILCSNRITSRDLETAERMLTSFIENFEIFYGESNVVFNVHLARHLIDCVKFLGPLFTYSNYCFEDHIGHLLSLQKGTTDVAIQICEKYIMEKHLLQILPNSPIAYDFFKEIESKHKFPISEKVDGSVVIGKAIKVCGNDLAYIKNILNIEDDSSIQVNKYSSVLLNSNVFYEISHCLNKRTDDTFIFNTMSEKFAIIESILVIQNKLYFLVNEKFEKLEDECQCMSMIYLKISEFPQFKLIQSQFIGPKFAFVKFGDVTACSKFPNMFERN